MLSREWWEILLKKCIEYRLVDAALTPLYLAGAYEILTSYPDRNTLLQVTLDHLLDEPANHSVPFFYRCGGHNGPVVVRLVTQQQVANYSFGRVHPPDEHAPAHFVVDSDVWKESGATVDAFKQFLISQYGEYVAGACFSRNPKGKFVKFKAKDLKAIAAAKSILKI